jgi:hypothetical protein
MKTRRILSTILAIVFVLSTFTFSTATVSAESKIIYVDRENGNDENNGLSQDAAVNSFSAAFGKISAGDVIHVIGHHTIPTSIPAFSGEITIKGDGADSSSLETANNGYDGSTTKLQSDIRFEDILIKRDSHYGAIATNGHKLTIGDGAKVSDAIIHVGPSSSSSIDFQQFVVDGGIVESERVHMGGGYINATDVTIKGNLLIEVLKGKLGKLVLAQDLYGSGYGTVYVGGNINVRVGADGEISEMTNDYSGEALQPKGSLVFIVEEGGQMCDINISNFDNKEYFYVNLPSDIANGTVDFSEREGYQLNFDCADGYIAVIDDGYGNLDYAPSGDYKFPEFFANNRNVVVSFTNTKQFAGYNADLTLSADPDLNTWTVESANENVLVEAVIKDSEGTTVDTASDEVKYYEKYTYSVTLSGKDNYVIPQDFAFTINGKEPYSSGNLRGYKIDNFERTGEILYFEYTDDYTAAPEGMVKVSYEGGEGAYILGEVPETVYLNAGDTFTVSSSDSLFGKLGHYYESFTDGTSTYAFGSSVTVPSDIEEITLSPVWIEETYYEVKFIPGDATGGSSPDTAKVLSGEYVTIPENTYSYLGYDFVNWADEGGNTYNPGEVYVIEELIANASPAGTEIVLTAQWKDNGRTEKIVYVSKDGNSRNNGATIDTPVVTLSDALKLIGGNQDAIIVVYDELTIANGADLNYIAKESLGISNLGNITITGYDNESVINVSGNVVFGSDTIIENVKLNVTKSGLYIATNGYKSVIGPNLENVGQYAFDIIDGNAYGEAAVDCIDTTILNGVKLGTYYLGGKDLNSSSGGVLGDVKLTVKGAEIKTLDFSPKGTRQATFGGHIVVTVFDSKIGSFKSSLDHYEADNSLVTMLFFNDSSMPDLDESLIERLKMRNRKVYIVDSGIGGTTTVTDPVNYRGLAAVKANNQGTVIHVYDPNQEGVTTDYTEETNIAIYNIYTGINKVRFGDAISYSEEIEITIDSPVADAPCGVVNVSTTNNKAIVSVESWTPDVSESGGKFGYEKVYTANVKVSPVPGYYFELDNILPAIKINGEYIADTDVKYTDGGAVTAKYTFASPTAEAPVVDITFDKGDGTGSEPGSMTKKYLDTIILPGQGSMSKPGFKFLGWTEWIDGQEGDFYSKNSTYLIGEKADVKFVAEWGERSSASLPSIIILYDLSAYAKDKGRNPQFKSTDTPIKVDNAFANLEIEIAGTKATKKTDFDYEKNVTKIASDGKASAITINNWSLDSSCANIGEFKYVTIVYYYDTKNAKAEGQHGSIVFGNCKLQDGSTSGWVGKSVTSMDTVVANKWASITFDFSSVIEESGLPSTALYRQLQMSPIGKLSCSELAGDTLYLKSMTFSKYAPEK